MHKVVGFWTHGLELLMHLFFKNVSLRVVPVRKAGPPWIFFWFISIF